MRRRAQLPCQDVQRLLHDLEADGSAPSGEHVVDHTLGCAPLGAVDLVEQVDEDVGVDEVRSAPSAGMRAQGSSRSLRTHPSGTARNSGVSNTPTTVADLSGPKVSTQRCPWRITTPHARTSAPTDSMSRHGASSVAPLLTAS